MSDLADELRALCTDECYNRIDYRCVICRGADALERLAAAEAALVDRDKELISLRGQLQRKRSVDNLY